MEVRAVLITIFLFVLNSNAFSQVDSTFSGIISIDTTISGKLNVNSDIIINEGVTLTVEPGTILNVTGNYGITVNGAIHAVGTETSKITIRSASSTPIAGDWKGIVFTTKSGEPETILDNLIIKHAATGIYVNSVPNPYTINIKDSEIYQSSQYGIRFNNSLGDINRTIVQNYGDTGIYVEGSGSEVSIRDSKIDQQSTGFVETGNGVFVHNNARLELTDTELIRNAYGLNVRNSTSGCKNTPPELTVYSNTIHENKIGIYLNTHTNGCNYGVSEARDYPTVAVSGNDIYSNSDWNVNLTEGTNAANTLLNFTNNWWGTTDAVEIAATIYDASDAVNRAFIDYLPLRDASKADSSGVSTSLNYKAGWITGEETWDTGSYIISGRTVVQDEGKLEITSGVAMEFAPNSGLETLGTLTVSGVVDNPIVAKGFGSSPDVGSWNGIKVSGVEAELSSIEHLEVHDAITGIEVSNTGLNVLLGPIRLAGLVFTNISSSGITINASGVEIQGAQMQEMANTGLRITNAEVTATGIDILNYGDTGIYVEGSGSEVSIRDSKIDQQSTGFVETGNGVFVHNNARLELTDTELIRNAYGLNVRNSTSGCKNTPPELTVYSNTIHENKIGIYLNTHTNGCNYGVSEARDYPTVAVSGNDIYSNSDWNVNLTEGTNAANTLLNFTNNWWGTTDAVEIAATIYDASDAVNRAFIDYLPLRDASKADSSGVSTSLNYKAGWITGEETWDTGSYIISGRTVVQDEGKLEITSGVAMEFAPNSGLETLGTLTVSGVVDNPIVAKGFGSSPDVGSWNGIKVSGVEAELSSIEHLEVHDAITGIEVSNTGLNVLLGPIRLAGLVFTNISSSGITINASGVEIQGAQMQEMANTGLRITNAEVTATGIDILNYGDTGIYVEGSGSEVSIRDSKIDQQSTGFVETGNGVFVHNNARLELTDTEPN